MMHSLTRKMVVAPINRLFTLEEILYRIKKMFCFIFFLKKHVVNEHIKKVIILKLGKLTNPVPLQEEEITLRIC